MGVHTEKNVQHLLPSQIIVYLFVLFACFAMFT